MSRPPALDNRATGSYSTANWLLKLPREITHIITVGIRDYEAFLIGWKY